MECYKEPEWFPLDDDNPAQPHKLCPSRPLSAHCFVGYARAEDCSLDGGDMMKKAAANSARAVAVADTTTTANSTPHTVTHSTQALVPAFGRGLIGRVSGVKCLVYKHGILRHAREKTR